MTEEELNNTIIYGVKIGDLDKRLLPVAERLAYNPTERLQKFGSLRIVADNIFKNEEGSLNREYLAELHNKFLECEDPNEYYFAMKWCKSYGLYLRIKKDSKIFREELEKWKLELEIKLRSRAFRNLMAKGKTSSEAAKYVFEGKYKEQLEDYLSKSEKDRREEENKVIYSVFNDTEEELERYLKENNKKVSQ